MNKTVLFKKLNCLTFKAYMEMLLTSGFSTVFPGVFETVGKPSEKVSSTTLNLMTSPVK